MAYLNQLIKAGNQRSFQAFAKLLSEGVSRGLMRFIVHNEDRLVKMFGDAFRLGLHDYINPRGLGRYHKEYETSAAVAAGATVDLCVWQNTGAQTVILDRVGVFWRSGDGTAVWYLMVNQMGVEGYSGRVDIPVLSDQVCEYQMCAIDVTVTSGSRVMIRMTNTSALAALDFAAAWRGRLVSPQMEGPRSQVKTSEWVKPSAR